MSEAVMPEEPFTRAMILRAVLKGVGLFLLLNVVYAALQPVSNGQLPTLYNTVFPGRLRLLKDFEFDAYRLVSDHIVARAQPDTYNILFLGSSEIWGSRTSPTGTVPAYLDNTGLVAADGRPVRIYNLGYPIPYALKDLTLLEVVVRLHLPVDLVVISSFDSSFQIPVQPHPVVTASTTLETSLIAHYGLPARYLFPPSTGKSDELFLPFWNDNDALLAWSSTGMRGLLWNLLGDDIDNTSLRLRRTPIVNRLLEPLTIERSQPSAEMLAAFAQFQQEQHIPVLILGAPLPVTANTYADWLREQTRLAGLPLLDCWQVFPEPDKFEDYYHITVGTHELYARILAKHLADTTFAESIPGLPLTLPPEFVAPEQSCLAYPVTAP